METSNKAMAAAQWIGLGIGVIALIKILQAFGVFDDAADVATDALFNNPIANGSPQAIQQISNEMQQQSGSTKPPTKEQIKAKTPSSSTMLAWKNQLIKAAGIFDDDESGVYNVIRSIGTKLAFVAFDKFFQTYQKKNIIDYLREFMNNDELAVVSGIIAKYKTA